MVAASTVHPINYQLKIKRAAPSSPVPKGKSAISMDGVRIVNHSPDQSMVSNNAVILVERY